MNKVDTFEIRTVENKTYIYNHDRIIHGPVDHKVRFEVVKQGDDFLLCALPYAVDDEKDTIVIHNYKDSIGELIYEFPSFFGHFIFRLRHKYGWSRKLVASYLNLRSESSIMNFETGFTTMKPKHINLFCKATPDKISVPTLFAMFEVQSLKPPCTCVCHHDMSKAIKTIYNDDGLCLLCNHSDGDCSISNGLWFEKGDSNFFNHCNFIIDK